jgi:hypothetical protein
MELTIKDLKQGDVILCHTPLSVFPMGILSTLIRIFLGIPYNHVKSVGIHNGQMMITESDQHGTHPEELVQNMQNSKSTKFLVLRFKDPWSEERMAIASRILQDTWGKNYGWFLLVKYAFAIITGQPFRSKKARRGQLLVCSHPQAYAFGLRFWWQWTPKTWYESELFENFKLKI